MAVDQRYCLQCGQRRGDPRLPFMDAVVFMDAVKRPRDGVQSPSPPPPAERRSRMTANASLIAGVATLVLAIGVGVMIGREGGSGSSVAAAPAPQIIKVGGGGEETATASTASAGGAGKAAKDGNAKKAKAPEKAVDSSGTSEAAAEILKPAGDVKLPPPTVQPGGECESGASGCKGGEFTGEFFGE
jgi:hypothetical protein